jgi:hypothetical protein
MLRKSGAIFGMALLVAGCAGTVERAEEFATDGEWTKAVIEYRKAHAKHQRNVEYKSRLKQTELKAAEFYYHQGVGRVTVGDLDGAIAQFQQGLLAMPEHGKLQQAMADVLSRKEAQVHYAEGKLLAEAGKRRRRQPSSAGAEIYPTTRKPAAPWHSCAKTRRTGRKRRGSFSSRVPRSP